jgi:hypothetical protein
MESGGACTWGFEDTAQCSFGSVTETGTEITAAAIGCAGPTTVVAA